MTGEILILDDTEIGFEREIVEIVVVFEENFIKSKALFLSVFIVELKMCCNVF